MFTCFDKAHFVHPAICFLFSNRRIIRLFRVQIRLFSGIFNFIGNKCYQVKENPVEFDSPIVREINRFEEETLQSIFPVRFTGNRIKEEQG